MTTEATELGPAAALDTAAAITAALVELESRPMSEFRTLAGPAVDAHRRAVELGDEELAQRATILRAGVLLREGRIGEGGQIAQRVRAWAEQHDSPYVLARAHRELSVFYRYVGDLSDGLSHAVQCVAHLTEDVPPVIRARHLVSLSIALEDCGSNDEGSRRSQEALRIARSIGDQELTLQILNNMAYTAFELDDEPAARAMVEQMRLVAARTGRQLIANERDTIARVEMMSGRYDDAESTLAAVLDVEVVDNEGDAVAECLLTLAELRRLDGRFGDAQSAVDQAVAICEERGLARVRARLHQEQAAIHAATGRYLEAYEEHRVFHAETSALQSTQRDARARALQAVFEATEARRTSEHFREMAHRDVLTGLYNRRYVNERLPALLGEAAAQGAAISVAILDLDHFKRINDTLSHATGDTVLQHIGEMLLQESCGPAIAARMGGEEFLLILPGVDEAEAALRCERLRLRIRAHAWEPVTGALPVTTSIGVTTAPDGRATPAAMLSQADRHLYAAKRAGRDRVVAGPG